MFWKDIKDAPRDGSHVICWRSDWVAPAVLIWKFNIRTDREYFGDPVEYDDYELADNQPTHFLPHEPLP